MSTGQRIEKFFNAFSSSSLLNYVLVEFIFKGFNLYFYRNTYSIWGQAFLDINVIRTSNFQDIELY